jgi:hypothetical protein
MIVMTARSSSSRLATQAFERLVDTRLAARRRDDLALYRKIPRLDSFEKQCSAASKIAVRRMKEDFSAYVRLAGLLRQGARPARDALLWYLNLRDRVKAEEVRGNPDPACFNLRDIGWQLDWHRPDPKSREYRNSLALVRDDAEEDVIYTLPSLLSLGLTPSDLGIEYEALLAARRFLPREYKRVLKLFWGDWMEVYRELINVHDRAAWYRCFGSVPVGIGEEA